MSKNDPFEFLGQHNAQGLAMGNVGVMGMGTQLNANQSSAPTHYETPAQAQYQNPAQTQYQAPAQAQHQSPAHFQYQAPAQTQYQAPITQYQAPAQTQYQAPAQAQYQNPAQHQSPANFQYQPQAPTQYQAPESQLTQYEGPEEKQYLSDINKQLAQLKDPSNVSDLNAQQAQVEDQSKLQNNFQQHQGFPNSNQNEENVGAGFFDMSSPKSEVQTNFQEYNEPFNQNQQREETHSDGVDFFDGAPPKKRVTQNQRNETLSASDDYFSAQNRSDFSAASTNEDYIGQRKMYHSPRSATSSLGSRSVESRYSVGKSPLDDPNFAPAPEPPVNAEAIANMNRDHRDPNKQARLPSWATITHSGYVQARVSVKALVMKIWKDLFWIAMEDHKILFFRARSDFDEWMLNSYLNTWERDALIKLRIDFKRDPSKPGVKGYRTTSFQMKEYGRYGLLHSFKLEEWMHYGPVIVGAFASKGQNDAQNLYVVMREMIKRHRLHEIKSYGSLFEASSQGHRSTKSDPYAVYK